ncbi:MAG: hypothetical protein K5682_05330, partial [Lachnospiraceae bacterium]|nr:hypothetical protein [Lachnospiraceae bacterium]
LQHPKAIVLELLNCTNYAYTVIDEYTHSFFDAMPYCEAKKQGIKDLVDKEDQIYYWLPIGLYHSRWKTLTEADYQDVRNDLGGFLPSDAVYPMDEITVYPEEDMEVINEEMLAYLDKIIALCKQEQVALYFYVTPFNVKEISDYEIHSLHSKQANFNYLTAYAKEQGIPCLNFFHQLKESGLDVSTDFLDNEHTNTAGAQKVTRYLAEHLLTEYITSPAVP